MIEPTFKHVPITHDHIQHPKYMGIMQNTTKTDERWGNTQKTSGVCVIVRIRIKFTLFFKYSLKSMACQPTLYLAQAIFNRFM